MNREGDLKPGDCNVSRSGLHCSFEVVSVEREAVTIRDLDLGGKSVTNDAAFVVEQLRAVELLPVGRRLLYYDSEGNLDEILWDEKRGVTGFKPGPLRGKR